MELVAIQLVAPWARRIASPSSALASSRRPIGTASRRCCTCQQLPLRLICRLTIRPAALCPWRATSTWGIRPRRPRITSTSRSGHWRSTARCRSGCRGTNAGSPSSGRCQGARASSSRGWSWDGPEPGSGEPRDPSPWGWPVPARGGVGDCTVIPGMPSVEAPPTVSALRVERCGPQAGRTSTSGVRSLALPAGLGRRARCSSSSSQPGLEASTLTRPRSFTSTTATATPRA